jgi:hypothetical protein
MEGEGSNSQPASYEGDEYGVAVLAERPLLGRQPRAVMKFAPPLMRRAVMCARPSFLSMVVQPCVPPSGA